jgi:hypothetical protein
MRFIILLAGTIMVAMGVTLYPGTYTIWISSWHFPKYMFIYEIYHPIGWHHYGRNGSDSLSWYIHDMDFIVTFSKIQVYIWDLSSYCMTPLWSQLDRLSIMVYTRHGFSLCHLQNIGLYTSSSFCWLAPLWPQWDWLSIMAYTQHGLCCGSKIQVCKWD